MISRSLVKRLVNRIDYKKAIILFGPRQVGKSTIAIELAKQITNDFLIFNGDSPQTSALWDINNVNQLIQSFGKNKLIILDEAQMIENIGLICKIIIDKKLDIQLVITGSSSLNIANKTQEPLTGRKWEYMLYPISCQELMEYQNIPTFLETLPNYLVTGMYPEVVTNSKDAIEIINNITNSYLYKDILALTGIKKPQLLEKILKALSWQVGGEVSLNELSSHVGADIKTVDHYIYLLEQAFVVYRLGTLSRNGRNEINTKKKIFFYDNGIRNALIGDFRPINLRNDIGALWENFIIVERKKLLAYNGFYGNIYFWRNKLNAEIDYIEEIDGKFYAYEFKWNPDKKVKFPQAFIDDYQPAETKVINKDNFWQWLSHYPY